VKANYSAFPLAIEGAGTSESGLTKRELIAAMALQGILSNAHLSEAWGLQEQGTAAAAASFADALIEELSK
jgi:hypothetical protein